MSLGENIARLREERGLSQQGLADRAGITGAYVSMLETGKRRLPGTLEKIADALGVTIADLFRDSPHPEETQQ